MTKRSPWDDSFWMAQPSWYPQEGKTLRERVSAPVIAYTLVAFGAFIIGFMVGYAVAIGS